MLAVSIFAVVAVAINSTFSAGLFTWRRTQETQDLYQDIRLTLNKMTGDLENAVLYSDSEEEGPEVPNFVGLENELSFYSLAESFRTIPVYPELRRITYSLDESTHILQRLEQTFPECVQETMEQEPEQIAVKISNLNFSYCYKVEEGAKPPYEWKDAWDSEQGIPQGVKIELRLKKTEDVAFTKYVFIPVGKKGQE